MTRLITALWSDTFVEDAKLSFQISMLRKALGEGGPHWIETLPKHGCRLAADVNAIPRGEDQQAVDLGRLLAELSAGSQTVVED